MRPIWKGAISFGLVTVPVKVYSAVSRKSVRFHQLSRKTGVKIAHAETSAGMGTWATTGFTASSLSLATPSTLKVLPEKEVYHVDLLWTLSTGP